MNDFVNIRTVDVDEIYDLRQRLLRPNQPVESVYFIGDKLDSTKHIGIFNNDVLVGCATIMLNSNPTFNNKIQYQMRGVAVEKEFQKKGYGKALVKYAEFLVLNRNADFIWLNARVDVRKFYEKMGYTAFGEEFNIPNVCKHILMSKKVITTACEGCKNVENKTL